MDLTPLQAFALAARLGSISAVAAELGYSQSAVSRQLQSLEREFGAELLRRTARGVRLTARGRALLPHAEAIAASWEAARADVAEPAIERVRLRVGAFPSGTSALLAPALGELERAHPDLVIGVRQAPSPALVTAVATGELDGAIVMAMGRARRTVRSVPLLADEMVVITAAPVHDPRSRIALAELAGEVWIEEEGRPERILVAAATRAGFAPRRIRRAPDLVAKVAFVAAGLGVAMVPGLVSSALPKDVDVVRLIDPPRRGVSWIVRQGMGSPALGRVWSALSAVADAGTGAPSANSEG